MGYFTPEYAYTTRINERIDVYCFGVVLLELVTGKEANEGDGDLNLAEWAWKHFGEGDSMVGALDPQIKDPDTYLEEMSTVFKLGLICTSTLPSSRPSMKDVLEILRRCNPLDQLLEEMKEGREKIDVAPLLKRESYAQRLNQQDSRNVDLKSERPQVLVPNASIHGPPSSRSLIPLEKPSLLGPIQAPDILNKQRPGFNPLSPGTTSSFSAGIQPLLPEAKNVEVSHGYGLQKKNLPQTCQLTDIRPLQNPPSFNNRRGPTESGNSKSHD